MTVDKRMLDIRYQQASLWLEAKLQSKTQELRKDAVGEMPGPRGVSRRDIPAQSTARIRHKIPCGLRL